jgi:uncharacterized protein (TIGR03067 family)
MRRIIWLLAGVLLAGVALGSDAPKEYDGAIEEPSIEGTWEYTRAEYDGILDKSGDRVVVTFCRGIYTTNRGDGDTIRATYRLDPARKPRHLDWCPTSGKLRGQTLRCIYAVEGDTLRVANMMDDDDFRRPQGFNDKGLFISVFRRVK